MCVAYSLDGKALAVTCNAASCLSVFAVDPRTSMLSPAPGSPYYAQGDNYKVAFSPDRRALAATDLRGYVTVFVIDPATYTLTVAGSYSLPIGSNSVAFSPDGSLLAIACGGYLVALFAVDPSTHALTEVAGSPFVSGSAPLAVAFSPDGKVLAVANNGANSVSVFAIDVFG